MTYSEVITELLRAIPEFKPDQTDIDQRIAYLVLNDLVQFTFKLDPQANISLVHRIFDFYENLCASSDWEVQMLARDVAWAIGEQADLHRFIPFIGNCLRRFISGSPAGAAL